MVQVGRAGLAALAVILVLDFALVALAVRHVQATDTAGPVGDAMPSGDDTRGDGDGDDADDPGDDEPPPDEGGGADRADGTLINIGSGDAVIRADAGGCGAGGGQVALSSDGGQSWQPAELQDAAVIVRVFSQDANEATVVAGNAECSAYTTYQTTDGGTTWSVEEGTAGRWHRLGDPIAQLHAPSGLVDVPCEADHTVLTLSLLTGEHGFVLCTDGALLESTNAGDSWVGAGTAQGVADLDFVDTSTALAVAGRGSDNEAAGECEGVAVLRSADGGQSFGPHGCLESEQTADPHISVSGDGRAYISVGAETWFSGDGGASWELR